MQNWKFKDYHPKDGKCQIEEWYEEQDDEAQAEFDLALLMLAENEEWSEVTDCVALTGEFVGLYEIIIDAQLPTREAQIRPIGIWRPDSPNFIILLCCEKTGNDYSPPLSKALEYKTAWEKRHEGEIYDHIII